ncbi:MAG: metallopeptidase TldD-related protein [Planctomycetota bacterium]
MPNGLLVCNAVHYTNLMEPREMVFTGMTRGGTFRIEGGRITRPVHNLRFTESLVSPDL